MGWFWKIIGGVITLAVTTGVALWIYKKQSNKALSYRVVSISPLMPLQARGFTDLKVHKAGKPIERPFLITVKVTNSGDLDIQPSDFAVPLSIRAAGSAFFEQTGRGVIEKLSISVFDVPYKGLSALVPEVVDARVTATSPSRIPVDLQISGASVQIKPLLLNVGDDLTIEILINGDVRGIEVAGRVAGVKQITEERTEAGLPDDKRLSQLATRTAFASLIAALVAVLAGSLSMTVTSNNVPKVTRVPPSITTSVIFVALTLALSATAFGLWFGERAASNLLLLGLVLVASAGIALLWVFSRPK